MSKSIIAVILFSIASIIAIVSAIYSYVILFTNKDKMNYTNGTIVDTNTALPETMKVWNSKFVNVEYWVHGKRYISNNKIQVAMNKSQGDSIKIAYLKDDPTAIILSNYKKANICLIIGIVCCGIALLLKYCS